MAGPRKVSQEQYDKLRASMEDKYGYDKMSDADKDRFDTEFDKSVVVGDKPGSTDNDDEMDNDLGRGIEPGNGKDRDDDDDEIDL